MFALGVGDSKPKAIIVVVHMIITVHNGAVNPQGRCPWDPVIKNDLIKATES